MSYESDTDLNAAAYAPPSNAFGRFVDGLNGLGSMLIFAVMLLICADVLMRNVFNAPIHGVAELVGTSVVVIVFLQLASTLRHRRMSKADIFIDGYRVRRPCGGSFLNAFFQACGVLACGIIVWATWPVLASAWTENEYFGVQGVFTAPTWPVKAAVVLGAAVTALQYLLLMQRDLRTALQNLPGRLPPPSAKESQ
jgi:TRAP-type mannitol/chloroaromatic compound transport system permease small subunit